MREPAVLIIVIIGIALVCGCTGQPAATTPSSPVTVAGTPTSGGSTARVIITATSFDPAILNIKPGTTVTWINEDRTSHRVVHLPEANNPELFHSEAFWPGESFSYTFREAGRYSYGDPQHGGGRSPLVIVG
jgi:plastocyanin